MKPQHRIFWALLLVASGCQSNRPTSQEIESYVYKITTTDYSALTAKPGFPPGSAAYPLNPRKLFQPYVTQAQVKQALGVPSSSMTDNTSSVVSWRGRDTGSLKATFDENDSLLHLEVDTGIVIETIGRSATSWTYKLYRR